MDRIYYSNFPSILLKVNQRLQELLEMDREVDHVELGRDKTFHKLKKIVFISFSTTICNRSIFSSFLHVFISHVLPFNKNRGVLGTYLLDFLKTNNKRLFL